MHSSAFQDQRPLLPAGGRTDHDNPVRALHQAAQPVEHHWILHIGRKAQESGLINNAVGIIRREFLVIYNDDLVDETVPEIAQYHPHEKEPASGESRSEEHTSELQSLMRISYAAFCLNKKITNILYFSYIY